MRLSRESGVSTDRSEAVPRVLPHGLLPVLIVAALVVPFAVFFKTRASERALAEVQFEKRALERAAVIEREFKDASLIIETLATSLSSSEELDSRRFARLTDHLLADQPGIKALGYNVLVTAEEREAFEAERRAKFDPEFRILEIAADGGLVPAAVRDLYIVVTFIEPEGPNRRALGLDVGGEPVRRRAFDEVLRTGRPTVTGRIDLVQDARGSGLLLASAVHRVRSDEQASGGRRRPDGFAVGVFDIARVFAVAMAQLEPLGIDIRLLDETGDGERVLHLHRGEPSGIPVSFDAEGVPRRLHRFRMAGRQWAIEAQPGAAYRKSWTGRTPWILAGASLLLAIGIVLYVYHLVRLNDRLGRALDARRASDRRFRELVDDVEGVVWEAELPSWRYSFVSKRAESLLGYPVGTWIEDPDFWRNRLHPEDCETAVRERRESVGGGQDKDFEYRLIAADGSIVWIEDVVRIVKNRAGLPVKLRGLMIDISERKRLEEERAALTERSVQSRKLEALGTLSAGVAHDFNNSLTSIRGHADILRSCVPPDGTAARSVAAVSAAAGQATRVTKALLTFAKETPSEKAPHRIAQVVEDTLPMISSMMPGAVTVVIGPPDPQDPWVAMDAPQIQQVFLNLAINSRDAMPDGGELEISVRTEATRVGAAGPPAPLGYVVLGFDDSGRGIDEAIRGRVFEPFFSTKPRGQGTGLGLSIAHGIVRDHGGAIDIVETDEPGAHLRVWLPRCRPVKAEPSEPFEIVPERGAGRRIVVVEDNEDIRDLLQTSLGSVGYDVVLFEDGRGLRRELDTGSAVDLLVLDVDLPDGSGVDHLRAARGRGVTAPAILMSGLPAPHVDFSGIKDVEFVQKPFGLAKFALLVAKLVDRQPRSEPSRDHRADTD